MASRCVRSSASVANCNVTEYPSSQVLTRRNAEPIAPPYSGGRGWRCPLLMALFPCAHRNTVSTLFGFARRFHAWYSPHTLPTSISTKHAASLLASLTIRCIWASMSYSDGSTVVENIGLTSLRTVRFKIHLPGVVFWCCHWFLSGKQSTHPVFGFK